MPGRKGTRRNSKRKGTARLERRKRRTSRRKEQKGSTRKNVHELGPLAMAYLLSLKMRRSEIDPDEDHKTRGALVAGYVDGDSFILFNDLPSSLRKRENCCGNKESELDFRRMLADSGVLTQEVAAHRKIESPEGKRRRESLGLSRGRRRELLSIDDDEKHILPHNFYQTYYSANTS